MRGATLPGSIAEGLRRAAREPRLGLALWLVNLSLAAGAGIPAWLRWRQVLDRAPEADILRSGMRLGVLGELFKADRIGSGVLGPLVLALVLLALVVNALTSGGVLEVLLTDDRRPFLHRFGRGAGRFFGRFLRAGLLAGAPMLVLAGLVLAAVSALARRFQESGWEPAPLAFGLLGVGLVLLVVVVFLLGLDLARIRLVREDGGKVLRALASGLGLVLRHPIRMVGLWIGNAILVAAVVGAYLGLSRLVVGDTWPGIVLLAAAQQAVMLGRAGLRVALFGSEMALVESAWPGSALPATMETAPAVPAPAEVEPEPPSPS